MNHRQSKPKILFHQQTLIQPCGQQQPALQNACSLANLILRQGRDDYDLFWKRAWHDCKCHTRDALENDGSDAQMLGSYPAFSLKWKFTGAPCIGLALLLMASQFYWHPNPNPSRKKADFTEKNLPAFSGSLTHLYESSGGLLLTRDGDTSMDVARGISLPKTSSRMTISQDPLNMAHKSPNISVWKKLKPRQKLSSKLPLSGNVQLTPPPAGMCQQRSLQEYHQSSVSRSNHELRKILDA